MFLRHFGDQKPQPAVRWVAAVADMPGEFYSEAGWRGDRAGGPRNETKAQKLAVKGEPFDLDELIRMEADRGTTTPRSLVRQRIMPATGMGIDSVRGLHRFR